MLLSPAARHSFLRPVTAPACAWTCCCVIPTGTDCARITRLPHTLAGIFGCFEILKEGVAPTSAVEEDLAAAKDCCATSCTQLERVLQDISDLSKLSDGQSPGLLLDVKRSPIRIGPIIRAGLLQVDKAAEERRVSFAVVIDSAVDGEWAYVSDDARILQVFSSLIASAVRHARPDSTLTVCVRALPAGPAETGLEQVSARLRIEITDVGRSISPALKVCACRFRFLCIRAAS